ncbi:hypothetical protein [Anthocerotibacter panamensis]|uniref:hypothetical protein n=1 Tax=Anthocerotibacter panamensis TaxID=2857077 RepID=UPI001C405DB9|nr:hypothetical protein [Anthocerotibacter panamensis]
MRDSRLERPALREYAAKYLSKDGNLLLLGVPGSGRRSFIEGAVQDIQGTVLYLDCLRTTDKFRFITLLAQSFLSGFGNYEEGLEWVSKHLSHHRVQIDPRTRQLTLLCTSAKTLDRDFARLLELPQLIAERKQKRVVVFLNNFMHLGSWDRDETWQSHLRERLDRLPDANYVLGYGLGNAPELGDNTPASDFEVLKLLPLTAMLIRNWFSQQFTLEERSLEAVLGLVQGHVSTAHALARHLPTHRLVEETDVEQAQAILLEQLSPTFETLLMQLPAIQCRVLETLALDPTSHPQSNDYTQEHGLPRGGSLQGALTALVKKDLLFGPDTIGEDKVTLSYQFCQPLLGLWVQQYLA